MIEREQMVLELKERLKWLERNASENVDDASEAEAIRQFLRKLESPRLNLEEEYFSPQEAMKRFWGTYETRMEVDHERQKILTGELVSENGMEITGVEKDGKTDSKIRYAKAGELDTEKLDLEKLDTDNLGVERLDAERKKASENVEKGFFWYLARHKRFAVAAVALMVVVMLVVGGTVGAYAESQAGIFSFFQKDEKRMEAVVNPGGGNEKKEIEFEKQYSKIGDLPNEYRELLMLPTDFYNEYYAEYVVVADTISSTLFKICYSGSSDENVFCYQQCFKDKDVYFFQAYDEYVIEKEEMIEGTKVSYYQSEKECENKYIASFYVNDILLVIVCNINMETVERFAESILKQ